MKILLIGDYSNVHPALALGLRELGHEVTVVSDGDGWKDYPRDIDVRRPGLGRWESLRYVWRLWRIWRTLRGYDVVQLINPVFLPLRAERIWPYYQQLRRHNRSVFLGAFGMDHYWVKAGLDCRTFRYSDFNIGPHVRTDLPDNEAFIRDWLNGPKAQLALRMTADVDGIIAGLYEYHASYRAHCPERHKLTFIPFPIVTDGTIATPHDAPPVRFFIGIQSSRSAYKGTNIMLRALRRLQSEMSEAVEVREVHDVPFAEYRRLMLTSDVILDQLYSYTPAMNALEAMSHGLVVVGGGEPESYAILGETTLRPIINVEPTEESVYAALRQLAQHPERLAQLKRDSMTYVSRHHDHRKVAQQYLDFWQSHLPSTAEA